MNKITFTLILLVFVAGAFAAFVFFPIAQFPAPTGPYGVGQVQYHWIDSTRLEPNLSQEGTITGQPWFESHPRYREPMTYIFYPTEKNTIRSSYDTDAIESSKTIYSKISGFPAWMFSGLNFIKTNIQWNAPIEQSAKKYPVVIFSHGFGPMCQHYTWYLELLASHGYIAVGINHPYVAQTTRYPNGQIAQGLVDKKGAEFKKKKDRAGYEAWKELQITTCSQDIKFVIDKLYELTNFKDQFLSNYIDTDHIAVAGQSFGGRVATHAYLTDPRISCCINMDGLILESDLKENFSKPFMYLQAEGSHQKLKPDGLATLKKVDDLCKENKPNIYKISFKGIGHGTFSDNPILLRTTLFTQLLSHYYDFLSHAEPSHKSSLQDSLKALFISGEYVIAFFDRYLKGADISNSELCNLYPDEVIVKKCGEL